MLAAGPLLTPGIMEWKPAMASNSVASDVKRKRLKLAWLLLASFLVYANTLTNGFVSDDHQQIESNPYAHSFRYVGKIFTTTVWSFQGNEGHTNYYRPLMTFAYVLCDKIFQTYPFGFHLVNLFLNCLVVWLVFRLGERALGDERIAFVAAILFAFHPVHSEAVAWIAAVTELQLAVFYLLSFLLFLRLGEQGVSKVKTVALLTFTFLLALFSKEQAVTLPVLATVYEHFYRDDRSLTSWSQKISRYGGLWILTGAYLLFRVVVLHGFAPVAQRPDLTVFQLGLSGLALIGQYAAKLVWPHPLIAFYLFEKSTSFSNPGVLSGIVAVVVFFALGGILWRYARPYSFWLIWLGVTLAPVLNVRWMAASAFAERYLYLPSVGFCFLVAGGVVMAWNRLQHARWARFAAAGAGVAFVAMASLAIFQRNRQWHDDEKMITADLARQPHASYLRANLGAIEWSRRHKDEAVRQWRLALADKPDNAIALCNLGMALIDDKKWSEAESFLKSAIAARPRFASPHMYLGDLYLAQERTVDAETEYRRAIEIFPLNTEARNRLGRFYKTNGRVAEAEEQFRASLKASPTAEAWNGLGDVLLQQGRRQEAAEAWRNVVDLEPFDEHARLELGQIYQAEGRHADAEKHYRVVLLLDPGNEVALSGMRQIKPAEFRPLHP
jgi:protein O-mannosyl-transferase